MGREVKKVVAVDFDGTIVKHKYPDLGEPIPEAIETLRWFQEHHVSIVLWTMRSGKYLLEALEYLEENGIVLFGVNTNPEQHTWTESPKAYAQIYIDDAAFGCPLIRDPGETRGYVDWKLVQEKLSSWVIHPNSKW